MPAIPIYSSSPINAAKPSGVTPKTSRPEDVQNSSNAPVTTAATSTQQSYPAAQPGARPPLPIPTGTAQPPAKTQPTPTRAFRDVGPPPPQPGAVPMPPSTASTTSHLPPPPKAGETLRQQPTPATSMPMPPQMSYPPPSQAPYIASSTSTAPPAQSLAGPRPTQLQGSDNAASFSHPPGYQQDVHASELSSHQRIAQESWMGAQNESTAGDEDEGVWDTAKKWAVAAGEGLAAAENEVWRRINKD